MNDMTGLIEAWRKRVEKIDARPCVMVKCMTVIHTEDKLQTCQFLQYAESYK